jgi:hypothetical protein
LQKNFREIAELFHDIPFFPLLGFCHKAAAVAMICMPLLENPPCPPFFKGENPKSPLEKRGPRRARGDFDAVMGLAINPLS